MPGLEQRLQSNKNKSVGLGGPSGKNMVLVCLDDQGSNPVGSTFLFSLFLFTSNFFH